jgi:uncharacterized ferritin-like protein (DUF455 family)
MQFYQELETILQTGDPNKKTKRFFLLYDAYKKGECTFESHQQPKEFPTPSYAQICQVVSPRDVPKRTNLTTNTGQVHLLHAVAHIEYSAIDLALDICYRFRDLPQTFYDDWLEVADDEIRHFWMIEKLLNSIGAKYGDVVVHNSLFEASQRTAHSLVDRLAVVPRYLEANGLDATPQILKKLQSLPESDILNNIKASLKQILEEEIDHVAKGDKWFAYMCEKENLPKTAYIEIIRHYYPNGFEKLKQINKDARLQAGFTCEELYTMVQKKVC